VAAFWFQWRAAPAELRSAAYELGRFTERARRILDRVRVVQVPTGVAWAAAAGAVALVPRWLPRAGALPRTPWVGAACLHPFPLIAGVKSALTVRIIAHEFAHVIWPHLDRGLRANFPAALAELERTNPDLTAQLDQQLSGYKDRRSPDECHVRVLEWCQYGRTGVPAVLWPYYDGWIGPPPEEGSAGQ
jgi:hypothetical protein